MTEVDYLVAGLIIINPTWLPKLKKMSVNGWRMKAYSFNLLIVEVGNIGLSPTSG